MRAADALLVPLGDEPALAQFVPSKLFDCAAIGRPVIVAARGEAPRIAEDAGAALIVAPGDAGRLAGAVKRLRDEPDAARAARRTRESGSQSGICATIRSLSSSASSIEAAGASARHSTQSRIRTQLGLRSAD